MKELGQKGYHSIDLVEFYLTQPFSELTQILKRIFGGNSDFLTKNRLKNLVFRSFRLLFTMDVFEKHTVYGIFGALFDTLIIFCDTDLWANIWRKNLNPLLTLLTFRLFPYAFPRK